MNDHEWVAGNDVVKWPHCKRQKAATPNVMQIRKVKP